MAHALNPQADLSAEQPDAPGVPAAQDDASQVSGQDPQSLFGIAISYDSGAAGTAAPGGEHQGQGLHDVNQPNQYPGTEPISGVSLGGSGAPGAAGINPDDTPAGARPMTVSDPNNFAGHAGGGSGTQFITVTDSVSGPDDWTATQNNYPPQFPVISGDYYPVPGGPGNNAGRGKVLRGGYLKGQR